MTKNTKEEKYIIVCDESTKFGKLYSFFYGGAMIKEKDYSYINDELYRLKHILIMKELKRNHIDSNNASKYIQVLTQFFDFVRKDKIKIRIMFCQNKFVHCNKNNKNDVSFNKFYYFFFKIWIWFNLFYRTFKIKNNI